jgi:hypothetical protein
MRNFFIILSLFFFTSVQLFAQAKYDYNWLFGFASPEDNDTLEYGYNINFNENPIDISTLSINIDLGLTNATMSDSTGQLLFYTNGCSISNILGETMENGDSLNPGQVFGFQCDDNGNYTIPEGILIIPKPNSISEYYIFHQGIIYISEPDFDVKAYPLYYSIVNMESNNGAGKVIEKNQVIIDDTLHDGRFNIIKHTNGNDWWVIAPRETAGDFYSLLVKADTIEGPFFQHLDFDIVGNGFAGQSVFSPDGNTYVQYKVQDGVYIYDFDRSTGLLSNYQRIPLEEFTLPGGCAISSNSRYLYVNTDFNIYQFDLEAPDIGASKILVAEYDGFQAPFSTQFFLQQLGPDCRIYINSPNGVDVLHVIKYPNRPGLECEVVQHGVQLPHGHGISLPNFPHYRTGTNYPICDSTLVLNITTPIFELPDPAQLQLSVYPNPASEVLHIRFTDPVERELVWHLYNAIGQWVMSRRIGVWEEEVEVDVGGLPEGIYFYGVEQDGRIVAGGKVVRD